MASACTFCSLRSEGIVARASEFISNWWAAYTVLHNRGLMEEVLRKKRDLPGPVLGAEPEV